MATKVRIQRQGYSGKPLHEKLGLKAGMRAYGFKLPEQYFDWLEFPGAEKLFKARPVQDLDFIHVFLSAKDALAPTLDNYAAYLSDQGQLWASWRKGKLSDVTDNDIRAWALAQGLVDVKVCAVSDEWSGLKLVRRKEFRN